MRAAKEQLDKLRETIEPTCRAHGLELVDVRFAGQHGMVLQVLIERQGQPVGRSGVSLGDCQAVSRDVSVLLEGDGAAEFVPAGGYRLEVSSPGVDRPLVNPRDFERFAGSEVMLRTHRLVAGRRHMSGVLRGIEGEIVKLSVGEEELTVPLQEIARANLVYRF
jgi:ribosome maturation factor RimP